MANKQPSKKSSAKSSAPKSFAKPAPSVPGYPQKRRTPIRKPGKRKPVSERNPNRVAPRIVRRAEPLKPTDVVVPQVTNEKALNFAQQIAARMKAKARLDEKAQQKKLESAEIRLTRRPTTRKQGANTEKFPAADLKDFKKRLMAARANALAGVSVMKSTGFNEADDHEADGGDGTNQTLRLQALGHMGSINRMIQQIDEAMHRIDDGSYGVCTACGQLIRKQRLINQPFVLTCMECQSAMELDAKMNRATGAHAEEPEVE